MEIRSLDYYISMDQKLKELKKEAEKEELDLREELRDGQVGFFEKVGKNSEIRKKQEEIRTLTELERTLNELYHSKNDKYSLPDSAKSHFDDLSVLLDEEETRELKAVVNVSLSEANRGKRNNIKMASINVQQLLDKLRLSDRKFPVYGDAQKVQYIKHENYEKAVEEIEKDLLNELTPTYVFIHGDDKQDIISNSDDERLVSEIEDMIKNNQLEHNKTVDDIVNNFSQIKEMFALRKKCNDILLQVSNTISEVNNITEIDITDINKFLSNIEAKYEKELEKANKYLSKFDFNDIKNQIKIKKENEEKERIETDKIVTYQNLAYELEKARVEDPNNYQKISEIQEQMRDFAIRSGLTEEQLDLAKNTGKDNYHKEVKEQKIKVEAAKAKIEYEDQLKKDAMAEIREKAIEELESSGWVEEQYEYRNGDVYSLPIDKEAMIQRKIEEFMEMVDMTPEERGLRDWKKSGTIRNDATLQDLTSSQLNTLRVGYSDSALGLTSYKKWKARESVKPQANTIYKEYIKYRASLEDKTEFLSFSDYAKQMHNIDDMSDIMVDEELKEEMREQAKGFGK